MKFSIIAFILAFAATQVHAYQSIATYFYQNGNAGSCGQ
jgi:hypothetical protein